FDLYCQLLKQAVAQIKGQKLRLRVDVDVRLDFVVMNEAESAKSSILHLAEARIPAFIPVAYVSDSALRIKAYRGIAEITTLDQLNQLKRDWRDRFGTFPPAVDNLLLLGKIKIAAAEAGITRVEVKEGKVMLTRRGDFILVGGKFPRLVANSIESYLGELLELLRKV